MSTELHCPKPQRPHERALPGIESNSQLAGKRARPSPPPSPSPPSHRQHSSPRRSRSSSLEDLDLRGAPPKKRRRLQSPCTESTDDQRLAFTRSGSAPPWPRRAPGSIHCRPQLPTDSPIDAWIFAVLHPEFRPLSPPSIRPSTCPATVDLSSFPPSLATMKHKSQPPYQRGGNARAAATGTSRSGRPGPSNPDYRAWLQHNFVTMDLTGSRMPEELSTFARTRILHRRDSPPLGDEAVDVVTGTVAEIASETERQMEMLRHTDMFPFKRPGIKEGADCLWNSVALPDNPEYWYDLSAPKPDLHFGYPSGQAAFWTCDQLNVISHQVARPYTQPTRANTFPFLMVEMKAEAAGGTLWVAENQVAGSGSHSVRALLWLLREAGALESASLTDTVAFSITMSHREAIFYLHWYSEADQRFYMSFLESYSTVKARDIRACHDTVKNILDHGLGPRLSAITRALAALSPPPEQWGPACQSLTISSTYASGNFP